MIRTLDRRCEAIKAHFESDIAQVRTYLLQLQQHLPIFTDFITSTIALCILYVHYLLYVL